MKKILVLISLVVLVAGCLGGGSTPITGDGVAINSFTAEPTTVNEGDIVTFFVDVENKGTVTATKVTAELSGVQSNWFKTNGDIVASTLREWGVDSNSGASLAPPDKTANQPGETKQASWLLKTPSLGEGDIVKFPVTVRVNYNYMTTGSINIKAMTKDFQRILQGKNQEVTNSLVVTNSEAPVKILVERATAPIIIDPSKNEKTATYLIKFKNVGDGFPSTEILNNKKLGQLTGSINIWGPGAYFKDCLSVSCESYRPNCNVINLNSSSVDWVKLSMSKGEFSVGCTVGVDTSVGGWNSRDEDIVRLDFRMDYRYFIQKEASVQVTGK